PAPARHAAQLGHGAPPGPRRRAVRGFDGGWLECSPLSTLPPARRGVAARGIPGAPRAAAALLPVHGRPAGADRGVARLPARGRPRGARLLGAAAARGPAPPGARVGADRDPRVRLRRAGGP